MHMSKLKKQLKHLSYKILPGDVVDIVSLVRRHLYEKRIKQQKLNKNLAVIKALLKSDRPIKLELGSGKRPGMEDWTSIDLYDDSDLQLDLSEPLPFPDNCVGEIYSSHVLEHFFYHQLTQLLAECYRVLKPGGIFNVVVPDAKIYLTGYLSSQQFYYQEYCLYNTGLSYKAKIDYVNYMAYMGGHHRHMFDEESLLITLANAGFKNVKLREFNPDIDIDSRKYESIYAIGEK